MASGAIAKGVMDAGTTMRLLGHAEATRTTVRTAAARAGAHDSTSAMTIVHEANVYTPSAIKARFASGDSRCDAMGTSSLRVAVARFVRRLGQGSPPGGWNAPGLRAAGAALVAAERRVGRWRARGCPA